jgi:hypothetical protein
MGLGIGGRGFEILRIPPRSPNLNPLRNAGRDRSKRNACLSSSCSEASRRRTLTQCQGHYHIERNNQRKGNSLSFPYGDELPKSRPSIECSERLGTLLSITTGPREFLDL